MVQPDLAVFGEKDYQQVLLIRHMAEDLCFPIEIVASATVREEDGLAMSSRNRFLASEERARAPELYRALCEAATAVDSGDQPLAEIERHGMSRLEAAGFRPDYFAVRDARTLDEPTPDCGHLIVLAAAWLGRTRLIDNLAVQDSRPATRGRAQSAMRAQGHARLVPSSGAEKRRLGEKVPDGAAKMLPMPCQERDWFRPGHEGRTR
jgi:pantoate--beta-alanine ligase